MKYSLFLLLGFGLLATSKAQTIFWGSNAFEVQLQSDGTSDLTAADFTFQIGTFHGGVDPTTSDANQLAAAWKVAGQSGYSEEFVLFTGKITLDGNGHSDDSEADVYDFRGTQFYIWAFTGNKPAEDNMTEVCHQWAMFTGDWTVPTSVDQTTLPLEYRTSTAAAGAPIYGGLNNVQSSDGGTFTAPTQVFELQTHEICLTAIPEPSSAALLALGACALMGRRKR